MDRHDDLRHLLESKAGAITELTPELRNAAIAEIMRHAESHSASNAGTLTSNADRGEIRLGFGIHHDRRGAASFKVTNYFISWKRLLFAGGSIPVAYLESTLTAMTILAFLVRGGVHIFDQIDAHMLAVIHKNANCLPATTSDFLELVRDQIPPEINDKLYMKRLVTLADLGTINIDGDILTITEPFVLLGG